MRKNALRGLAACAAIGLIGFGAEVSQGALARATGGSGLSGNLSSNRIVRKQQLIADPANTAAPLEAGAPRRGSSSVSYDPNIVTLSGLMMGMGYAGSGVVQIDYGEGFGFQDIATFLEDPAGPETGFAQVFFHHGSNVGLGASLLPSDNLFGPPGEPGQIAVAGGYTTYDADGPAGFDTHQFFFDYLQGVPDSAIAQYTLFANIGDRGTTADFLVSRQNGQETLIPAGIISSASVRANLVPLPPAMWGGLVMLGAIGLLTAQKHAAAVRA